MKKNTVNEGFSLAHVTGGNEAITFQKDYFTRGIDYLLGVIDLDADKQQAMVTEADDLTIEEKIDCMQRIQVRRTVLGLTVILFPYVLRKVLA